MYRDDHTVDKEVMLDVISSGFLSEIKEDIGNGDIASLKAKVQALDAADLAVLLEKLSDDERQEFIECVRPIFDFDCLPELSPHVQQDVVQALGVTEIAHHLTELESDDAFSLIEDLLPEQQEEILASLSASDRESFKKVFSYPEGSAARLMQQEVVTVPSFWKVGDVLKYLQVEKQLPEAFYEVYVVNPRHIAIGALSLHDLLRHAPSSPIRSIMRTEIKAIPATMDNEEVAYLFQHYNLISAPVQDEKSRIVGMITSDDVVDVIGEEAERDILNMARVGESDFYAPFFVTSYRRVGWLVVTMINALLGAFVIEHYQETIEQRGSLAALMTIVAAMGGASGTQVVAVTVRAFATRLLTLESPWHTVIKESLVGLMNAVIFSIVLVSIVLIWMNDLTLALILPAALIFNICWSALAGVLIPVVVQRIGLDPAVSAGPLLTATTDVIGFASFLGLAKIFL